MVRYQQRSQNLVHRFLKRTLISINVIDPQQCILHFTIWKAYFVATRKYSNVSLKEQDSSIH